MLVQEEKEEMSIAIESTQEPCAACKKPISQEQMHNTILCETCYIIIENMMDKGAKDE